MKFATLRSSSITRMRIRDIVVHGLAHRLEVLVLRQRIQRAEMTRDRTLDRVSDPVAGCGRKHYDSARPAGLLPRRDDDEIATGDLRLGATDDPIRGFGTFERLTSAALVRVSAPLTARPEEGIDTRQDRIADGIVEPRPPGADRAASRQVQREPSLGCEQQKAEEGYPGEALGHALVVAGGRVPRLLGQHRGG